MTGALGSEAIAVTERLLGVIAPFATECLNPDYIKLWFIFVNPLTTKY